MPEIEDGTFEDTDDVGSTHVQTFVEQPLTGTETDLEAPKPSTSLTTDGMSKAERESVAKVLLGTWRTVARAGSKWRGWSTDWLLGDRTFGELVERELVKVSLVVAVLLGLGVTILHVLLSIAEAWLKNGTNPTKAAAEPDATEPAPDAGGSTRPINRINGHFNGPNIGH